MANAKFSSLCSLFSFAVTNDEIPIFLIYSIDFCGVNSAIIFTNGIFCDVVTAVLTVLKPVNLL